MTTMIERLRPRRDRLPRVQVELDPWCPAWVLRLAAALLPGLLVLGTLTLVPAQDSSGLSVLDVAHLAWGPASTPSSVLALGGLALAAVLVLSALRWPGAVQPLVAILATGALTALTPGGHGWALLLAPLGYLAFRLAVLAAPVPWGARIEWAVLARAARADVLVVGVTLAVGTVGVLVEARFTSDGLPAGLVLGALGVLGLAWWVRRRP